MEELDLKQMGMMVKVIAEEKNLAEEVVLDVIQAAIAAAWRRDNGDREMNVRAELNVNTGEAEVFVAREVVEAGVGYNPATEIPQDQTEGKEVGEIVEEMHKVTSFGRVASMTAKQVVMQRLREEERDAVLEMFEDKIGTVVSGTIVRVEPKIVRIDLGRTTGIMPRSEQIEGERYVPGTRIKVLVKGIERDERGAQLILSRGAAEFIEYLFRQEVPELNSGAVEVKGLVRESGKRTKIAVVAKVAGIDPVGAFVGGKGVRVQTVMAEIGDREKIDVVNWSDNISEFIMEALSPAEVMRVEISGRRAKVFVTEEQQSIAIGRQGQNVRLASKLTGYDLDIELAKPVEKKRKPNVEDSLLSAIGDSEGDAVVDEGDFKADEANSKTDEGVGGEGADEEGSEAEAAE